MYRYNVCTYIIFKCVHPTDAYKRRDDDIILYYYPRILHVYHHSSMLISRRPPPPTTIALIAAGAEPADRYVCVRVRESKSYLQYFEHRTLGEIET